MTPQSEKSPAVSNHKGTRCILYILFSSLFGIDFFRTSEPRDPAQKASTKHPFRHDLLVRLLLLRRRVVIAVHRSPNRGQYPQRRQTLDPVHRGSSARVFSLLSGSSRSDRQRSSSTHIIRSDPTHATSPGIVRRQLLISRAGVSTHTSRPDIKALITSLLSDYLHRSARRDARCNI